MRPEILFPLFRDNTSLKGVGPKLKAGLDKLCGKSVLDVLWHMPRNHIQRIKAPSIANCLQGDIVTLKVVIGSHTVPDKHSKIPYRISAFDNSGEISLVFFKAGSAYMQQHYPEGETRYISGRIEMYGERKQMPHPDFIEKDIKDIPLIEPIYPQGAGVSTKQISRIVSVAMQSLPQLDEWIDPTILAKEKWKSFYDSMQVMHYPTTIKDIEPDSPHRKRLAYDELLSNQITIAISRMVGRRKKGTPIKGDETLRNSVINDLPFTLTNAQMKSLDEIYEDMNNNQPMMRLLQGDVGAGKTLVALLAMLNAVEVGSQALLISPTEILAKQHFKIFSKILSVVNIEPVLLTGKISRKDRTQVLESIANGNSPIIIGTHALFQEDVLYKNLSLIVIDEQHRFGVQQRISLHKKGENPHLLAMTATPIPRTLLMTAFGDMETSKLDEKPAGRLPIDTRVMSMDKIDTITYALRRAIAENKQAYWVCPLVEESETLDLASVEERYNYLCNMFGPDAIALVHGKMKPDEKDDAMQRFQSGQANILVATTVIEVGVDVPNASIMIIEQSERFGLSQLHQLRGRVGRGQNASSCLLLYGNLTVTAKKRLTTMRETEDGFAIAQADLELRGPGDILGTRQSGLPEFKIADLHIDSDLLEMAKNNAKYILEMDPTLENDMGGKIRTLLYLYERDKAITTLRHSG